MSNINSKRIEILDVKTPTGESGNLETYAIVDGMNVALARNDKHKARLGDILNMIHKLEETYDNIETYVDASIMYRIDNINNLKSLINKGKIYQCAAGITADEVIWQRAVDLSKKGYKSTIITNDMFPVKKYSDESRNIRNLTAAIIKSGDIYLIERNISFLRARYKNFEDHKRENGNEIIP